MKFFFFLFLSLLFQKDRIKPGAHGVPLSILRKTLSVIKRGADVDLSLLSSKEVVAAAENETDDASWHGVDETPEESKERALRFLTWVLKTKTKKEINLFFFIQTRYL